MLMSAQLSSPMSCSLWWRKPSLTKRYMTQKAFYLNVFLLICINLASFNIEEKYCNTWNVFIHLSGTHLLLTHYGAAEEVSRLWWNTYWRGFYYQIWCEAREEPRGLSGQKIVIRLCNQSYLNGWKLHLNYYYYFCLDSKFWSFTSLDYICVHNFFPLQLHYQQWFNACFDCFPSDCEWIFCALFFSTWPAKSLQECCICNRQEWINVRNKDASGETVKFCRSMHGIKMKQRRA